MSRHRLLILLIMLIVVTTGASGQSVTPERDGLEKGEGVGIGLFGEINGYPETHPRAERQPESLRSISPR